MRTGMAVALAVVAAERAQAMADQAQGQSQAQADRERDRATAERDRDKARADRERDRAQAQADREEDLYSRGTEALDEEHWDRAMEAFDRVVALGGSRADAGLYWLAYAQSKA